MAVNVGISTTGSTRSINRRLHNLMHRQIPFAASKALNDTGNVLLAVNKREMRKQFDKPVRYTLNAFRVKYARKNDLNVRLERKSAPAGKHYLEIEHKGGNRPRKGFETMLRASLAGRYTGNLMAVLPTSRTQTKGGTVSMARVDEAIAGLKAGAPTSQRRAAGVAKQAGRIAQRKSPVDYFIGYKGKGKNKTDGIYKRTGKGVQKMFHLIDRAPGYNRNFPFYPPLVRKAKQFFPSRMRKQLAMALRTARF